MNADQIAEQIVDEIKLKLDGKIRPNDLGAIYSLIKTRICPLVSAAEDFIDKVESGRARSTDSYNKFKKALGSE
jgi:hypothetical protein